MISLIPDVMEAEMKGWVQTLGMQALQLLSLPSAYDPGSGLTKRVIAIAGESGSGKSTTATYLKTYLEQQGWGVQILHMDHYFKLPPIQNHNAREQNIAHVGMQEVNLALLQRHVWSFHNMVADIVVPSPKPHEDAFEKREVVLEGAQILLIEGTYVLNLKGIDLRIFLEHTYHETYERRLARNRDIMTPFVEQVLAIEHELIQAQKPLADILISTDYNIKLAL